MPPSSSVDGRATPCSARVAGDQVRVAVGVSRNEATAAQLGCAPEGVTAAENKHNSKKPIALPEPDLNAAERDPVPACGALGPAPQ